MPQKIKVAQIEKQDGKTGDRKWTKYTVISDDGSKASTFDTTASNLKIGDTIEAEIELKGKFANLKSFKVTEHSQETGLSEPKPDKGKARGENAREENIAEAVSVKAVIDLLSSGVIDLKHPLAQRVMVFLDRHLPEPATRLSQVAPEAQKSGAKEQGDIIPQTDELFRQIREARPALKTDKNIRDWLVVSLKIKPDRIDTEPEKVWQEVKQILQKGV